MRAIALGMVLTSMLAGGSAQAAMTASAELSSWKLTLIDLDPNDGITPSLTWTEPELFKSFSKVDLQIGDSNADWTYHSWSEGYPLNPNAYEYSILRGTSGGSVNGNPADLRMSSSVEFRGADGAWNITRNTTSSGELPFVLSPMTGLSLSADVLMSAPPTGLPFVSSALSYASATLFADGRWGTQVNFNSLHYGGAGSLTKTLAYTINNATTASTDHYLYLTLASGVNANFTIAAVPEPSTWGMLLMGAATVGAVARRRQRG